VTQATQSGFQPARGGHSTAGESDRARSRRDGISRENIREALPLLLFAIGAFVVAFFLIKMGVGSSPNQAPLWSLFAALGVITTCGGVAVLAASRAGSDEPSLSAEESPALVHVRAEARPSPIAPPQYYEGPTAADREPSWVFPLAERPPLTPLSPRPARSSSVAFEEPKALRPVAPAPSATDMEQALDEMQSTLESLAAEGRSKVRTTKPPAVVPKSTRVSATVAPPAPTSPVRLSESTIPGRGPPSAAQGPASVVPPKPPKGARCVSCGLAIESDSEARPCVVCGERLCWLCELKSLDEGRYLVCDRCFALSGKSASGH
jgi:hypothetical protein